MTEKHDVIIDNGSTPVAMGAEPIGSAKQPGVTTTRTATQYTTSGPGGQVHYDQQEKLGSKCCGFCCDMRRAVIILNIIFLVLNIMSIISYNAGRSLNNFDFNDDTLNQDLEDSYTYAAIFSGVTIAVSIVTILGANRYNMILVGLGAFWLIAQFIANIVVGVTAWSSIEEDYQGTELPAASVYYSTYIFQGIITLLYLYPHVGFMMEIKKGIMTPETYPREEFSCCCV